MEILIVITIIGVLTTVIVPSLQRARDKALDAAIMVNLNGIRGKAHTLYTEAGSSYASICSNSEIARAVSESGKFNAPECADDTDAWAAEAELEEGNWYCVDSAGNAEEFPNGTIEEGADYECGP